MTQVTALCQAQSTQGVFRSTRIAAPDSIPKRMTRKTKRSHQAIYPPTAQS